MAIGSVFNAVARLEGRPDANKHVEDRQAAIATNGRIDLSSSL